MSERLPHLVPVRVPWQISASAPFLRLQAEEGGTAEVTFVARFPHNEKPKPSSDEDERSPTVVVRPSRWVGWRCQIF